MGPDAQRHRKIRDADGEASIRPRPRTISSGTGAIPPERRPITVRRLLTGEPTHQHLAKGFLIGTRFHSAPVIRLADAKPVHLGHTVKADGRWRLFAFAGAGDPAAPGSGFGTSASFWPRSPRSPVRRYTPPGADIDAVIDVRAVFQQGHRELALEAMPSFLLPRKGRYGLLDYEKMFCPDLKGGNDIFDMRRVDREGVAWWSCGRTNTSRMFCRSMAMRNLRRSSTDSWRCRAKRQDSPGELSQSRPFRFHRCRRRRAQARHRHRPCRSIRAMAKVPMPPRPMTKPIGPGVPSASQPTIAALKTPVPVCVAPTRAEAAPALCG